MLTVVNIKSAFSQQKFGNLSIFLLIWMYFMGIFDMPRFQFMAFKFTVYWVFTHCVHIVQKRAEMVFESCGYKSGVRRVGEMCLDHEYQ